MGMEKSVRANDETVPAFTIPLAGVQQLCELDAPRPFLYGVGCGIFREAGGFGVEEEEHSGLILERMVFWVGGVFGLAIE
jgi:hypothetical protein